MDIPSLFDPLGDGQLFDDDFFWSLPGDYDGQGHDDAKERPFRTYGVHCDDEEGEEQYHPSPPKNKVMPTPVRRQE